MRYQEFERLAEVIARLRHPRDGCPWDLKQTHGSLLKYLIEEAYEYIHAVETGDSNKMEEELGDVLLQVMLHAQIASESGSFDIESVAKTLAEKMIERHPHVFQDKSLAADAEEVSKNWEEIKKKKSRASGETAPSYFNEEDAYMPALMAAEKIGKKSRKVNFDWDEVSQVFAKVEEELEETKEELNAPKRDKARLKEEIGDLLFSVAQLARHLDISAEDALREANLKFIRRFSVLESKAQDQGRDMLKMSVDQLEELWQAVKKELKNNPKI